MPSYPIQVPDGSPFPVENIPFGIFSPANDSRKRAGTAIGEHVVDLAVLEKHGSFSSVSPAFGNIFSADGLNAFASLPRSVRQKCRDVIQKLLSSADSELFKNSDLNAQAFHSLGGVVLHLPLQFPEFTDFSAFEEHVGNMFLMHNMELTKESVFYHNPMGYNGRVSSILPTATDFKRPRGFFKDYTSGNADFMPSKKLDYEMEMGFIMAGSVPVGERLSADKAWDHIFGFVLLNDWSARDILAYEMVPAGPFNGKASAASVSPWVIMPEAIASSSWGRPRNQTEGQVPSYLAHASLESTVPAIDFNVYIARNGKSVQVSRSSLKHSFYTLGQLMAYRASSGCGMRNGELFGSGTISSPESDWPDRSTGRNGCLIELSWDGQRELPGIGGTFLEDGDQVTMEAWVEGSNGKRIGFGQLVTKVQPADGAEDL